MTEVPRDEQVLRWWAERVDAVKARIHAGTLSSIIQRERQQARWEKRIAEIDLELAKLGVVR